MEPAFEAGDYVLVRRGRVPRDARAAGLVVCVRRPDERLLLKRVVGLPGIVACPRGTGVSLMLRTWRGTWSGSAVCTRID